VDEAWIRRADGEQAVRVRALNAYLAKGGVVTEARLLEGADAKWTIRMRLAGRPGEFLLCVYDDDKPRTYKDVAAAVNTIFKDMGYRGPIILSSEREYPPPNLPTHD
jgi:hypothetical protein